ncbi:MAG: metal ABC transporter permease [Rhodospirillales bacterium]|nr:MAG: metal ABC transporter permease [Rhodospirillales bacterium]
MPMLVDLLGSQIVRTVMLGAALVGAVSGMVGVFAVLRRQSLLSDTISHAALPGVCLGFLLAGERDLTTIMLVALLTAMAAALSVLAIGRLTPLKTDAQLGIVLSVYFAVGVVLLSHIQAQGGGARAGITTFLFGQAAALSAQDLWVLGGVFAVATLFFVVLWKEIKLATFDPIAAAALGLPVRALELGLTVLLALTIVAGIQLVGVVLMVAVLIAPAVAARQWIGNLGAMTILAMGIGGLVGAGGALLSATGRGLATGPIVVLLASAVVLVSILAAPRRGVVWQALSAQLQRWRISGDRVLLAMDRLAAAHHDPDYPSEKGMLDTMLGRPLPGVMRRLEGQGLVRPVVHDPESSPHWVLTPAGRRRAEALRRTGHGPD